MKTSSPTNIILIAALLLICSILPTQAFAGHGRDRGIMKIEFLYSIESTAGRGEKFKSPMDIYYDRQAQELYIADAGAGAIYIYDSNGGYKDKIVIDRKIGSPTMVAVDKIGQVYVGLNRDPKITVFNYRGELLNRINLPGIVDVPGNRIHPVYLAGGGPDGDVYALKSKGGIVKLDPDGLNSQEMILSDQASEDMPNMAASLAIANNGDFLFSDARPYSGVRYNRETQDFQRFGRPGILYGQIARPSGMATDDTGHVFMASLVRGKILCYDKEGKFVEEFGGFGRNYGQFYMPSRVASDGKDRLFVLGGPLKRVQVFKVKFLQEVVGKATLAMIEEDRENNKGGETEKL